MYRAVAHPCLHEHVQVDQIIDYGKDYGPICDFCDSAVCVW